MAFSFAVIISIATMAHITPSNPRIELFKRTSLKLNLLATLRSDLKIVSSSQKGNVLIIECCIRLCMSKEVFPVKAKTQRISFLDIVQIRGSRVNILFK